MHDIVTPAFLRAEAAWLAPPEPSMCGCDENHDDCECEWTEEGTLHCSRCVAFDEDYMKDPDRARDEHIDREMDEEYWENKYGGDDCLDQFT